MPINYGSGRIRILPQHFCCRWKKYVLMCKKTYRKKNIFFATLKVTGTYENNRILSRIRIRIRYSELRWKKYVVMCKKTYRKIFFLPHWRLLMKITGSWVGSESGSVIQSYGSADPDPFQNVTDPQHWLSYTEGTVRYVPSKSLNIIKYWFFF